MIYSRSKLKHFQDAQLLVESKLIRTSLNEDLEQKAI